MAELLDKLLAVSGAAVEAVNERVNAVSAQLGAAEARLAEVQRELANLEDAEVEAGWVADCLAKFDAVWDVLTPENRQRLVHAVVERVEVDEPGDRMEVMLADLRADLVEGERVAGNEAAGVDEGVDEQEAAA